MNDIPRGTSSTELIWSLAADKNADFRDILATLQHEPVIHDSKLDDTLSVTTVAFKNTPPWIRDLDNERDAFPKKIRLGTLWRGVDLARKDTNKRTEFIRAVMDGDIKYAETLAEFAETDVNAQDKNGWTALHWACGKELAEVTSFCLSLPTIDSGVKNYSNHTAFDIAFQNGNDEISTLFYKSVFEMERTDPDGAFLRFLTVTSEEREGPGYPGEALFGPASNGKVQLVKALMDNGVDLTSTTAHGETALHLAAQKSGMEMVTTLLNNTSRGAKFDIEAVTNAGLTALHYAAHRCRRPVLMIGQGGQDRLTPGDGDQIVQALVELGADTEVRDERGRTALHRVAEEGNSGTVQILLDRGANWMAKDGEGNTALQLAKNRGHQSTIQILLSLEDIQWEKRWSRNLRDKTTPLHFAARNGYRQLVQIQLDGGADIEARDAGNHTPLLLAAIGAGNHRTVKLLLDRGADVQAKSHKGQTALLLASLEVGNHQTVRLLLDRGFEVGMTDRQKQTALHLAVFRVGNHETVEELLGRGVDVRSRDREGMTALHHAVLVNKNWETVKILLAGSADPDGKCWDGQTALHKAAWVRGNHDAVRVLLGGGADMRAKCKGGETALHRAVMVSGNHDTVKLLLDRGAEIDATDNHGQMVLHQASMVSGNYDTVKLLLDEGAEIKAMDTDGRMPLHKAAGCRGNITIVRLLLDQEAAATEDNSANVVKHDGGGNSWLFGIVGLATLFGVMHSPSGARETQDGGVNVRDGYGWTALHAAALAGSGNHGTVELLIDRGAEVGAIDEGGRTVLHLAAALRGNEETVRLLLERGADVEAEDEGGQTPLDLAAALDGNSDTVQLMMQRGERWRRMSNRTHPGAGKIDKRCDSDGD